MKSLNQLLLTFVILVVSFVAGATSPRLHHDLQVWLTPDEHKIKVIDHITTSSDIQDKAIIFKIHSGLKPLVLTQNLELKKLKDIEGDVDVEVYQLKGVLPNQKVKLMYEGAIDHSFEKEISPGTIDPKGVVLMGSTYWYPIVDRQLVSFSLKVSINNDWTVISQGELVNKTVQYTQWTESKPQDDIYLIAGEYVEYSLKGEKVDAYVYLKKSDSELAKPYLEKTHQYLEMYSKMLGDYPYTRFSMIENFWETGFGMPSFTLLGPSVLRLPFILYTSYPHEVLHNWWGNGVFVDYEKGNWCEGLTAYMADHYLKKQRGQEAGYRRSALQNFSDYVNEGNDMPLSQFTNRHNSATRAIGYDKSLMFYHMLQVKLGEPTFIKGLRHFYKNNKFKRARFEDIQKSMEAVSGISLSTEFQQWVYRKGAPHLFLNQAKLSATDLGEFYSINFQLEQKQSTEAFHLQIPIKVTYKDGSSEEGSINMNQKMQNYVFNMHKKPVLLEVDPYFDVFRHPHQQEVPAVLSGLFGEKETLRVILPSVERKKYKGFALSYFKAVGTAYEFVNEEDVSALDQEKSYLILGWSNKFVSEIQNRLKGTEVFISPEGLKTSQKTYTKIEHSFLMTVRENSSKKRQWSWLGLSNASSEALLVRKIPHYGKYSMIGFNKASQNIEKKQWSSLDSPLKVKF